MIDLETKMVSSKIKKNLLDMYYNKNLQYVNTSIVLIFTYFIGILIAFVTEQIDLKNNIQIMLIGVASIFFLSIMSILVQRFRSNMKLATREISRLNL